MSDFEPTKGSYHAHTPNLQHPSFPITAAHIWAILHARVARARLLQWSYYEGRRTIILLVVAIGTIAISEVWHLLLRDPMLTRQILAGRELPGDVEP